MRFTLWVIGIVSLVLVLVACVSDKYMREAVAELEAKWKTENDRTLEEDGQYNR